MQLLLGRLAEWLLLDELVDTNKIAYRQLIDQLCDMHDFLLVIVLLAALLLAYVKVAPFPCDLPRHLVHASLNVL